MLSQLFADDTLLSDVAGDRARISRSQHPDDPAVQKVQAALLLWDPGCLPRSGADGVYGDETAAAVARFKAGELNVPPSEIVDDVGPRTVIRLDEIAAVHEARAALGVVMVAAPETPDADLVTARNAVEQAGGRVLQGIGRTAAIVVGGEETRDALQTMVGTLLVGVVTPQSPEPPAATDGEIAEGIRAWLAMLDPDYLLDQLDPHRLDEPRPSLGGCVRNVLR